MGRRLQMQARIPKLNPATALAGAGLPPMGRPMNMDPRAQEIMRRMEQERQRLTMENATLSVQLKHYMGILICLIQKYGKDNEARVPREALDKVPVGLGVNTEVDKTTDELVAKLITAEEYQRMMMGLVEGSFEATVPAKPPYELAVEIPHDTTFAGPKVVTYRGGKSDGIELTYVQGKPKKPREYTVDKNGTFTFTVDSEGMTVAISFFARRAVKDEEEEEVSKEPLSCKEDWHRFENDGDKIIGRCCPRCGDGRKVLESATV